MCRAIIAGKTKPQGAKQSAVITKPEIEMQP